MSDLTDLFDYDWEAMTRSLEEHASTIGHVTIAWTRCQLLVFTLFYSISGMRWEDARAIFFALKSDAQQRDITVELARERLTGMTRRRVVAAICKLNDLSMERNATIHTMWVFGDEDVLVPAPDIKHNPRLELSDPKTQFERLKEKLDSAHGALLKVQFAAMQQLASLRKPDEQPLDPGITEPETGPQ